MNIRKLFITLSLLAGLAAATGFTSTAAAPAQAQAEQHVWVKVGSIHRGSDLLAINIKPAL